MSFELSAEQQEILDRITKVWKHYPSLRFLQLIGNCFGPVKPSDIYFVSDIDFLNRLQESYHYRYGEFATL